MRKFREKSRVASFDEIAIRMSGHDNVAVAKNDINKDTVIQLNGAKIPVEDVIPKGHRFSLSDIKTGDFVLQYGYPFGLSKGVKRGQIINKRNVDTYSNNGFESLANEIFKANRTVQKNKQRNNTQINKTFRGYKKDKGRVGTRNYYLIVPTSLCASDIAVKIAYSLDISKALKKKYKNIDGIIAAAHTEGCGCNDGEIIERLMLTLKNTIAHPNVGGVLVIDLGCEKTNYKVVSRYFDGLFKSGKPIDYITIQDLGGTRKTFEEGRKIILERLEEVNDVAREEVHIKHLVIGTECGASDSFSGITSNPVIGQTVDKIIHGGGSAILSETPEMIGAEACLMKRMVSKEVAEKFIHGMEYYKSLARWLSVSMDGNFVPGNEDGGLINLTLKSLGAIQKGGSTEIVHFLNYSEILKRPGLSLMNGPGNDFESMTGIVASGANVILFSTGMGTTEGNLIAPVVKLSSRTEVYEKMGEDIDFNAGALLDESISMEQLSDKLLDIVIEVASGKKTWSETWGKRSFQIWSAGKLSL